MPVIPLATRSQHVHFAYDQVVGPHRSYRPSGGLPRGKPRTRQMWICLQLSGARGVDNGGVQGTCIYIHVHTSYIAEALSFLGGVSNLLFFASPFPRESRGGGIAVVYNKCLSKRISITATFCFHHQSFEVIRLSITLTSGNIKFFCLYRPPYIYIYIHIYIHIYPYISIYISTK